MDMEHGTFTAEDFLERAASRALPLNTAAELAASDSVFRGDHNLNPDFLKALTPGGLRLASVLIGVVDREPGATVILTLRAAHLPNHAGQIAFPGGRVEERDKSVIDAALREAQEEIGLAPEFVQPVGLLDAYLTRTGFRIIPVLSVVSPQFTMQVNDQEVAEVFEVPLEFLMTVGNHQLHSREWQGHLRHFYVMPYEDRYIWGVTAGILRSMYERLYTE